MSKPIMPVFAFERRKQIEREGGFMLAGQLIVDIRKEDANKESSKQTIKCIIQLVKQAAGRVPDGAHAIIFGWPGGSKPANAVDTDDDAAMTAWVRRSTVIALRIGEIDDDDMVTIDSDVMRQMGRAR